MFPQAAVPGVASWAVRKVRGGKYPSVFAANTCELLGLIARKAGFVFDKAAGR